MPPFEERIKEDGTITLLLNQTVTGGWQDAGDLQKEIQIVMCRITSSA